jgi:hypothetical protein
MKPSPTRSMHQRGRHLLAGGLCAAALCAAGAAIAADSDPAAPATEAVTQPLRVRLTPEGEASTTLKRLYLACEERAAQGLLPLGDAARCSQIYEALLREVFRGRYEDLYAWWKGAVAMP